MTVAPTRGPVQRPGLDRDLTEILQRLDDLERILGSGWRFTFDNEGGWGYVQTNDELDLDLLPDPLTVGGSWGFVLEEGGGFGMLLGSAGGPVLIRARLSGVTIDSGTSPLTLLVNGKTFQFDDNGDIHIPTGGNVIADT